VLVLFRRELVVYLNAFSGEATTEFPSTLQMARGGVCFFNLLTLKVFVVFTYISMFLMYYFL